MTRIEVLGGCKATVGGVEVELRSPIMRELLLRLAATYERGCSRRQTIDALWPDLPENAGRRRLSQSLWRLRKLLPGLKVAYPSSDRIMLVVGGSLTLDLAEFREALAASPDYDTAKRVVDRYTGEFASGEGPAWVLAEREQISRSFHEFCERSVSVVSDRGELVQALDLARSALRREPAQERLVAMVLRLHLASGSFSDGLRDFSQFQTQRAEDPRSEPSVLLRALALQLADSQLQNHRAADWRKYLYGRSAEMSTITAALIDSVAAGSGRYLCITGEPGSGKTRLCQAAAAVSEALGQRVLFVEHAKRSSTRAYGALRWELGKTLATPAGSDVERLLGSHWAAIVSNVVPSMSRLEDHRVISLQPAEEVWRQREAIVRSITALASIQPTVVVFDDCQWRDAETAAVMDRLKSEVAACSLVVIEAGRMIAEIGDSEIERFNDRRPVRMPLTPLDDASSKQLIQTTADDGLSEADVDRLVGDAGGNPFFLVELARATERLRQSGSTGVVSRTESINRLIDRSLDELPTSSKELAEALAVFGRPASKEALRFLVGAPTVQLDNDLQELVDFSLVEAAAGRYWFRHEIWRSAVKAKVSSERLLDMHLASAQLLLRSDLLNGRVPWHEVAAHAHTGGDPHLEFNARVNAASVAAAERSVRLAADHLADALQIADLTSIASEDEILDCLLRWTGYLAVLGDFETQTSVLAQARDRLLYYRGPEATAARFATELERQQLELLTVQSKFDAVVRALVASSLKDDEAAFFEGRALHLSGRSDEAIEVLEQSLGSHPESTLSLETLSVLGSALWATQRFGEASATLTRAVAECEQRDAARELVDALSALATLEGSLGRSTYALQLHARAVDLARRIGYWRGESLNLVNQATTLAMGGIGGRALQIYDEAEKSFRSMGDRRGIAFVRLNRAELRLWLLEDDDGAEADVIYADRFFRQARDLRHLSSVSDILANVARQRRKFPTAERHSKVAVDLANRAGDEFLAVQALRTQARLAKARGRFSEAIKLCRLAISVCDSHGFDQLRPFFEAVEASSALATGQQDAALAFVIDLQRRDLGGSSLRHLTLWTASRIADQLGHQSQAVTFATEAVISLEKSLETLSETLSADKPASLARMEHWLAQHDQLSTKLTVPQGHRSMPGSIQPTQEVDWIVSAPADFLIANKVQRRRQQLRRLMAQSLATQTAPSHSDFAALLGVSVSTIRRDIAAIEKHSAAENSTAEAG